MKTLFAHLAIAVIATLSVSAADDVTLTAKVTKNSRDGNYSYRTIEVQTSRVGDPTPITAQAFLVVEYHSRGIKSEPIGKPQTGSPGQTFTFPGFTSEKLLGWYIRLERGGRLVGVAGSSPKFEEAAANPAMVAQLK